jgi:hypothetical protein
MMLGFGNSLDRCTAVVRVIRGKVLTHMQYGLIFDVRWPSKKFKSTRRFCYVQYTSPVCFFCLSSLTVL